ncbi:sodium:solute symporter family protein [uncultured Desulfosarcina sp.]|uniref:sodium:solute symporter family protein n=1 Tax=uncultured Desulfosarcina sp. TaxID=218289 RepID=UPI0029C76A7E|nr:sodium:solute symporter family protein [uncultured Desulfosarcina sp.]
MKSIEIAIVVAYCVFIIGIGFFFKNRAGRSAGGFWSAETNIGVVVNAFALLATVMSGGGMMGNIGLAAGLGIPFILSANLGSGTGLGVGSLLVAKPMRKAGAKTVAEFIKMRFPNRAICYLVPIIVAITYIIYLVAQMKASGTVGQYLLGVNYNTGLVVTWLIFTFYVAIGGMLAVTWADFIQGMLMMLVVVASAGAALVHFGGFEATMATAVSNFENIGTIYMPISAYAAFFLLWVCVGLCSPHILMRVSTTKNPFGARVSLNGGMILITLFSILTSIVLGAATRAAIGPAQVPNPDAAFLMLLDVIFSPFWKGLAAAAIFSAIMSTAAGLLLAAAASIANDIIVNLHKTDMSPEKQATLGRFTVFAVSVVVLMLSFNPPTYLTLLYSAAMGFLVSGLMVPLLAGLWWKGTTETGALVSIIVGATTYAVCFFAFDMPKFTEIFVALPIAAICIVAVSFASKVSSPEILSQVEEWHA